MNRWGVAVVAALFTTGIFRIYQQYLLPLTKPPAEAAIVPVTPGADREPLGPKMAQTYFPDVPWTMSEEVLQWQRSEQALLFAQKLERGNPLGGAEAESADTVRLTPVAMLWKDPKRPDAPPYRLIAESAWVRFENPFLDSAVDLANTNPGRIVWASLEGRVRIDGPDGLRISGHNFVFSEQSAELRSDDPIQFAYGPSPGNDLRVRGQSRRVVLELLQSTQSVLGRDMPRIAGIRRMRLPSDVDINLFFQREGRPATAHVTSAGPFAYDFPERTATFQDDVDVTRRDATADPRTFTERLLCQWLELQFLESGVSGSAGGGGTTRSAPSQGLPSAGLFSGLELGSVNALGRQGSPIELNSIDPPLTANARQLTYLAPRRRLMLEDERGVTVVQNSSTFVSPRIEIEHDEAGQLVAMDCQGEGRLEHTDGRWGPDSLNATWTGSVHVQPDASTGLRTVILRENVRLILPRQFGLGSDQLRLWIDPELAQQMRGRETAKKAEKVERELSGPLPLKRVDASGNVRMISRDLDIREAKSITAVIHEGTLPQPADDQSIVRAGGGDAPGGPVSRQQALAADGPPWVLRTDRLLLDLVHDTAQGKLDVAQVQGAGRTDISRESTSTAQVGGQQVEGSISLSGAGLLVTNDGDSRQQMSLSAEVDQSGEIVRYAELSVGDVRIRGEHLSFDRAGNVATVEGAGDLQVPVTRDMHGNLLGRPALLKVIWQERMIFDGQTAKFFGGVATKLYDDRENLSKLTCESLDVVLDRRISFSEEHPNTRDLKVSEIHGRHAVEVETYEWTAGPTLIGKRHAQLAEFRIDQTTGEIFGRGPGTIKVWGLGNAVRISPNAAPQANRPAESQRQWRYTVVQFADKISGNIQRNQIQLLERVQLLSAPVRAVQEEFSVHQLAESTPQAEDAVRLDCDRLTITRRQRESGPEEYNELLADEGVELEGHSFRATADELTFDEQSERFVLRGHGRPAKLHFLDPSGERIPPSQSILIRFTPSKREVSIDGSTGVSAGF